jgi:hypothetical protein
MPSPVHLSALAAAVAAELTTDTVTWDSEPDSRWTGSHLLSSDEGHEIALIPCGMSITARAFLPGAGGHGTNEITMQARDAAYVCSHIRRRLMPAYESARAAHVRKLDDAAAETGARTSAARRIAAALGTESITEDRHSRRTTVRSDRYGRVPHSVHVEIEGHAESVALTVRGLSSEQAVELCALIHRLST